MKAVSMVALVLLIIGGLNWGLVGFFNYDLVSTVFGAGSMIARVIFDIVGIAAIVAAITAPMMMMSKKSA